ncbi:MAG: pyridoxamine 5'-phosphate oxidase family protein [Candidatus Binatus sp.]|jgi:PPOX class probable F420-dependent enzyme
MPNRQTLIKFNRDEQEQFLNKNLKAALATLDKNGFPHVVAMNYFYIDGAIYMTSYGKAQKVVNIRRNPKVGVMVESGRSYDELQGVLVRGHCQIIADPEQVRESLRAIGQKQGQRSGVPSQAGASTPKRVVLKIVPERITSWDHTKLGGRY